MAEDWNIPPWELESRCPYHWYEKWRARRLAMERRATMEASKWQKK